MTLMSMIAAEFAKLARSLSWTVVVLLPAAMVLAGALSSLVAGQQPADGWHTVWLRSVVFYGLFPLAIGVAVLGSLVWRAEHRGGNWNALMSTPVSSLRLVAAKTAVIAALAMAMQLVMLLCVTVAGKAVFALPGMLPARYLLISGVIMLATVPLAALQSGLSMLLRSFAAPVAVAFLGAGASTVLLLAEIGPIVFLSPYALATRATQLGTGTFADGGEIAGATVGSLLAATALLSLVTIAGAAAILDRRDTRT
ncbi:ABC transporter permease [Sediminivirga luteola]|uniref:ABC transporter n=1 Tax=Sediminivirga luteola TaxID=1774748 RepID=A0A8J2XJN0_9MICO|nr:ABC transporter permease [Sediminivirga luteola]MCI2266561.1 ABC transporter permease [Sediminivirga luteola]GGA07889.1 hypothetical protein GCM10011333_08380 [Sediminivirga luteola]